MSRYVISALALVAALAPTSTFAASSTITLRGYVPVICRATFDGAPAPLKGDVVHLGTAREFCNAGSGYRVVVSYDGGADPGSLVVDGRAIELDSSGQTVIAETHTPGIQSREIAYAPGDTPISNLNIRLETNG